MSWIGKPTTMSAFIHVKEPGTGIECWINANWVTRVDPKTHIGKDGPISGSRVHTTGASSYDHEEPPERLLAYLIVVPITSQIPGAPPAGDSGKPNNPPLI
jgi:hypothetical protein